MNVRDLGQLIIAKGFKKLPKVQKIPLSGHAARRYIFLFKIEYEIILPKRHSLTDQTKIIFKKSFQTFAAATQKSQGQDCQVAADIFIMDV